MNEGRKTDPFLKIFPVFHVKDPDILPTRTDFILFFTWKTKKIYMKIKFTFCFYCK